MDNKVETEILKDAISTWGVTFNLDMGTEEAAELIQAINKIKRTFDRPMLQLFYMNNQLNDVSNRMPHFQNEHDALIYQGICGEIADMKIMVKVLELIFNNETIDLTYARKMEHLKNRLAQHPYNK